MTLSLLNSLCAAANMILGGIAGRRLPNPLVLGFASLAALLVASLACFFGGGSWSPLGVSVGATAGLSGGIGLLMAYRAFAIGPVGVVGAIVATTSTAMVASVGFLTENSVSLLRAGGLALCIAAIAVVSVERNQLSVSPPALWLSIGSGLAAGGFAVLMNVAPEEDGFGPLLAVRLGVMVVAIAVITLNMRRVDFSSFEVWRPGPSAALAAGVADASANVFVILALRVTDLATIAVVSALTPALVALLGWLFLGERLRRRQALGLVVAVVAIALTARG